MSSILEHPWVSSAVNFIEAHPLVWFVIVILFSLNYIVSLIPQFDILKSKILLPIAKKYRQRALVKKAIKSDIRGHVNAELSKMKKYLPDGWVNHMDVDWVENEEPSSLIDDNRIIVRIRPVDDQDMNFVSATYHYLRTSFFPRTQAVIPKPHYEASVLHVCRKITEGRNGATKTIFEDRFMEPLVQRHASIPRHLDSYERLETRGFFTGTFLRELHLMATDVQFRGARDLMDQETVGMIRHIDEFITAYDAYHSNGNEMAPNAWYNDSEVSSYAILLVANPKKIESGVDPYINRARERFRSGTRRLYVFGSHNEKRFANAVIAGIEGTIDNIRLVERFDTPYDYRGDVKGVGAVFEISS